MRFVGSFFIACVIALALFLMMYHLVNHKQSEQVKPPAPVMVDVRQLKMSEQLKRQKQPEAKKEPAMAPLAVAPPAASPIESDIQIDMPPSDLQWENPEMGFEQKYWSQPGGSGEGIAGAGKNSGAVDDYIGEMNAGKKETVPISTTRPNIPKVAYENHIDGWVLLAFTVTGQGVVKNIRVMDAYPRGIFEANAIAAVRGWKYEMFKGPDIQLAQRIDFEWAMYPYNMSWE
jgi:periplasmic protein TonB